MQARGLISGWGDETAGPEVGGDIPDCVLPSLSPNCPSKAWETDRKISLQVLSGAEADLNTEGTEIR